jgi:hypothetical protein
MRISSSRCSTASGTNLVGKPPRGRALASCEPRLRPSLYGSWQHPGDRRRLPSAMCGVGYATPCVMLASAFSHLAFRRVRNAESVGAIASSASAMNFGARLQRPREWVRRWRLRPGMKRRRWPRRRGVRSPGFVWRACALIALALTDLLAASAGAWSCRRKVSGPLSRNDVSAVAPWHRVSRAMSRRLDDVSTAPWRYVSGPLSRNDIGTIATWDCVSRPMSRRLYNVALRLSCADERQHRCCQHHSFHNAPPLE